MNSIRSSRESNRARRQGLCRAGDLVARILAMYGIRMDESVGSQADSRNASSLSTSKRSTDYPTPAFEVSSRPVVLPEAARDRSQQTFAWFDSAEVGV